jgi:pimeloyl-ACP methyl ester carboxylesterase
MVVEGRGSHRAGNMDQQIWLIGGALLGAIAIVVYFAARAVERRNPPIGNFMTVDGVRLHYVERGKGPAVVLLHGNTVMLQDYIVSGILDEAALRCRVIAFDRPGFGYSERPRSRIWSPIAQANLIHAALDQLGIGRAVVVGHSWGTLVAVALALNYPQSVRSLVLLSGFYFPRLRFDVLLASPPAIPVLGDILRYTISPILEGLSLPLILRQMFGPPPVPERFRKQFPLSMILRPWQIRATAAEAALMVPAAMKLQPRYSELSMPVSIIAGMRDRVVTTERQSARLNDELPSSKFETVEGAGHMVHHVAPDLVLAAIFKAASSADEQFGSTELRPALA